LKKWQFKPGLQVIWVLLLLLGIPACLPTSEDYSNQSSLLAALERKSGLIAYVGVDGNIYTINQGGGKLTAVTDDAFLPESEDFDQTPQAYLFPTWSRDSEHLAFARLTGSLTDPLKITTHFFTTASDGSDLTEIYRSELFRPQYLYWSPDNEHVSFLTSTPSGSLLLQMVHFQGDEEARIIDVGSPFFWSWSPDGRRMLIHEGGTAANARLSLLSPQEDPVIEEWLEMQPADFQAPAWSPDGQRMLVLAENEEGENALLLIDQTGEIQDTLTTFENTLISFAWSYDSKKVAYIASSTNQNQGALGGQITVIDLDNPDQTRTPEDDQIVAFFWSPDNKKIAYFVAGLVPTSSNSSSGGETDNLVLVLALHILDVASGISERIRIFQPTLEFQNILSYFDQYHQSSTIWSPDSKNIVVSAHLGTEIPKIVVINASGDLDPRPIADGVLAFWSWE